MKAFVFALFGFFSFNCISAQSVSFGQPTVLFEHPQNSGNGTQFSYPFIPYDYNNDGILDFAGSSFANQYVYKGLSDGSFQPIQLTWSQAPIKIIDWNNDGKDDVVFERHILITEENDEFQLLNPSVPFTETITDIADLNNDQLLDLITIERVTFGANPVHFYLNLGNDSFEKSTFITQGENEVAITGDVSGDGIPDLLIGTSGTDLYINQGDATFLKEDIFLLSGKKGTILTDLNGDEQLDLILGTGSISAFLNKNGTIDNSQEIRIFSPADIITSGDLNNDGFNDIVSLYFDYDDIIVQVGMNDGQGGFPFQSTDIFSFPRASTIGIPSLEIMQNNLLIYDVNNDGKNDIVYIDGFSDTQTVNWVENTTITNTVDISKDAMLKVFPNPSSDYITIDSALDFDEYKIVSSTGRIINSGVYNQIINISKLPCGLYSIIIMKQQTVIGNTAFSKY